MKPIELYKLPPKRITKDISCLFGFEYSHVPEVEDIDYT